MGPVSFWVRMGSATAVGGVKPFSYGLKLELGATVHASHGTGCHRELWVIAAPSGYHLHSSTLAALVSGYLGTAFWGVFRAGLSQGQ